MNARAANPQIAVDTWNAQHKVGDAVKVTMDGGSVVDTTTRSQAWVMGGHSAVILLIGISGAYALERVATA